MFFEQLPGQRSQFAEVSRSLLLFGSASEYPPGFQPEAMVSGWFEKLTNGLSFDEYTEAVFLVSVVAQLHNGVFDLRWLDNPAFAELEDVIDLGAVRQTFADHLLTTPEAFKAENRKWQDPLPASLRKYAFNPLQDKPLIEIATNRAVAPWAQAILMKTSPPSIYHMARRHFGDAFSHDLGHVFQHYVGRQLKQIEGDAVATPEVAYGPRSTRKDSCDWFLELPSLLVLIECKARQPIESLRVGGSEWMKSVEESISRGIQQLNRSHQDIEDIAKAHGALDTSKPRLGLVVTLEPFYVSNNPLLQELIPSSRVPVGVISVSDLESLVRASGEELATMLSQAPRRADNNLLLIHPAAGEQVSSENALLAHTWESISLFERMASYADSRPDEDATLDEN
jgi:hypothetical protein